MFERMIASTLVPLILLLQALATEAGEYCQYWTYSSYYNTRYCDFGCCGTASSYYSDVCCANAGLIAGSVIGSLAGLAIVIGTIICCCVAANNSSRRTGAVIQPAGTAMQTLVVNNTAFAQGSSTIPGQQGTVGYGYAFGVPPPSYTQYNTAPQGGVSPSYPPPPTAKY
ncbi:hypothetical protein CHS0354_016483 [Potamilus streckersoni]|uniref:Cysteine and tyrosine-rich protein 1 n=1 Tax=Potamilus streckersoni TaxID=2493646 RepID=A0AAE0WEC3_9BIVA|nr:hypothetical protein CHS0354_016483 [Potamilus streckersoni]